MRWVALALSMVACGGAHAPAPRAPAPESDRVSGCWRDPNDGTVLCLEERSYVLLLPGGQWDRAAVDWAKKTPTERSGRTRTPRPLWLSVRVQGDRLVMDDGSTQTLLERPAPEERARIDARIQRLPEPSRACEQAARCEAAAGALLGTELDPSGEETATPRACIGFLNAVAEILREGGKVVPAECGGE